MKTTITFEDTPEDRVALQDAQQGHEVKCALMSTLNHIRSELKYGDYTNDYDNALRDVSSRLYDEVSNRNITLDY